MSLFLQSSTGSNGVTMDRGAGIYTVNYNPYNIDFENTFANSIAKPGATVMLSYSLISKEIFRNKHMYITFTAKTTDSTNFCTWLNVFSFCKKLVININKGKNKLIFENDRNQLRTLAAEYLLEFGDHIYEEMSEITPSFGSLSGYQVTNVSPKTIRFPLFWLIGYLFNNCIINNTGTTEQLEINNLDIEFTFREETQQTKQKQHAIMSAILPQTHIQFQHAHLKRYIWNIITMLFVILGWLLSAHLWTRYYSQLQNCTLKYLKIKA